MPISADIYNQFAPRVQNPLEIQNALGQNAQNQLALQHGRIDVQNALQSQQEAEGVRQAAKQPGFGTNPDADYRALLQVSPPAAEKYRQAALAAQKTQADTRLAQRHGDYFDAETASKNQDAKIKNNNFAIQKLNSANTLPEMLNWAAGAHTAGVFSDDDYTQGVAKFVDAAKAGPAALAQAKAEALSAGTSAHEQLTLQQAKAIADQTDARSRANAELQAKTHLAGIGMQQGGENSRAALARGTQLTIAGMNPDGTYKNVPVAGADGSIDMTKVSPEDLAAAYRYKTDGTLPPNMGRGQQGAMESRKLRAISAALDAQAGESPEDARVRQLAAKGDIAAINKMRQREVAVGANVKNFDFNADQVLQLSGKVDRTGVPIVNAWVNAGKRGLTGNPDLLAFDTAIKTTVNEFAQIVSGTTSGATAEGEKKKAEALLNAQQTPEGVVAVVNQMRIESQNRMKSFKAQRAESMPTNAARPPEAPATGLPQGWKIEKVK